jgi:hypothetical protein
MIAHITSERGNGNGSGVDPCDQDVCRNNHGGNPESVRAFQNADREKSFNKTVYSIAFCQRGGATGDEVGQTHPEMPQSSISASITQAIAAGVLFRVNETRKTRYGQQARVVLHPKYLDGRPVWGKSLVKKRASLERRIAKLQKQLVEVEALIEAGQETDARPIRFQEGELFSE